LNADGCLTKPFYIPDLVRTLDKLTQVSAKAAEAAQPPALPAEPEVIPAWLQDVNRAAQHLTRLSLESAAHAALIVRGGQLWAYAGDLPQDAAQELAQQLGRYWVGARQGQSDLARFVHLQTTASDYMLYATSLAANMALALAFNAATPFTKMRAQAADLARALASDAPKPPPTSPPLPPDDAEIPVLDLGDVPPPIPPRRAKQPAGSAPSTPLPAARPAREPQTAPAYTSSFANVSASFDLSLLPEAAPPDVVEQPTSPSEWIPAPAPAAEPPAPKTSPAPKITSRRHPDTRPLRLDPASPTVCSLSFACVLVPRLPQHHLVGEMADQIPELMRQVCLAFGWRLEHIAVRPDYLQWLVSVPPSTSASYLMRILRFQLSDRLFEKFPSLAKDNPSGDYWAPGYLIMSSQQLPPPHVVTDFVANTRRYQGAEVSAG
jgi:REP element-mobilizing transposase RayT